MAHDFAKQRSSSEGTKGRRSATRPPQPGSANWSWFFSGLMAGIIASIAAYLAVLKLEEGVTEDTQVAEAGTASENQPTFSFYNTLSQAEVAVNVPNAEQPAGAEPIPATASVPAAAQTVAAVEERPDLYLLQAGSFENPAGAESRRTSIILLNMNANVVEAVVRGRTLYSVQVGPFAGRRSAEDAGAILASNNIESIAMLAPQ